MERVKNNLKIYMIKKEMTQAELAEKLDVSQQQVNNWVTGRSVPKMKMLLEITDMLNCTIDDLYRVE